MLYKEVCTEKAMSEKRIEKGHVFSGKWGGQRTSWAKGTAWAKAGSHEMASLLRTPGRSQSLSLGLRECLNTQISVFENVMTAKPLRGHNKLFLQKILATKSQLKPQEFPGVNDGT